MAAAPSVEQILFVPLMVVVLAGGLTVMSLLEPALWVPKRSGLGWTLNFANPHAWRVPAYTGAWLLLVLFGLSHPDAPGIHTLLHLIARLAGGS